jgi:hypothetical protein
MKRVLAMALILVLAPTLATGCSKPTALASNANAKGTITVAAAPPKTPPPELPPEALAELAADNPDAAAPPATPSDTPAGPATVTDYRASIAADIAALPPVGDAASLAASFASWHAKAAAAPGATEDGQVQLGADPQEYRPSDAELVTAEAGDRLSAALQGGDEATKASVATIVGEARTYRRFDFRRVDVMGSGRYYYASQPRAATLPL